MKVLLVTPPMTQLNTPYPATAFLAGFLKERGGCEVCQKDLSLDLALELFSRNGVTKIFDSVADPKLLAKKNQYLETIEPVIRFLQKKSPELAFRICQEGFLPRGKHFDTLNTTAESLHWNFGNLGIRDRAQFLASLYLDDLSHIIQSEIDPHFSFSRYGERIISGATSFQAMEDALTGSPSLIDRTLDELTRQLMQEHRPDVVGITIPFPGNVYGAFRVAKKIKELSPVTPIVVGGGYVNTELRQLQDTAVFNYIDYLTFDDGEVPFSQVLDVISGQKSKSALVRTAFINAGQIISANMSAKDSGMIPARSTPSYQGLDLSRYLSLVEMPNPMHRLWSDGHWNKLMLAHGCYWKRCVFCDTSLDYIDRYEPQVAENIVSQMERLIEETGHTGFHFVDEAAPPALLKKVAEEILKRRLVVSWWGNIRFEKAFTPKLAQLLAQSGCIAVSGGLEVASDRLLKLMEKGVTVDQVAKVTQAFSQSGIMVHAYLMYGFPSQTEQETIDSLERVRQFFQAGCIQSAYWHRFTATIHSSVAKDPKKFGVELRPRVSSFANNDIEFVDKTGINHDRFYPGLRKAIYNYMHGIGLENELSHWFDFRIPKPRVTKKRLLSRFASPLEQCF